VTVGYIVEGGVTRQPYGGHRIADALNSCLTQCKYAFFSEVEFYLVRLAMEKVGRSPGIMLLTFFSAH